MPDTFISYRRDDSAGYAGRLREALERRLGRGRVFRDVDALQPGDDFVRAIDRRIQDCRAFVAVIGQQWLGARDPRGAVRLEQPDDHVRLEIASALARNDLLIVPVLVEGVAMPAAVELPESIRPLAHRHAIALRDDTWDADVDRLAAAIELVAGARRGGLGRLGASTWRRPPRRQVFVAAAALALLALLLTAWFWWDDLPLATGAGVPAEGAGYAIRLPDVAAIAHGHVVYTLLEGRVEPRGQAGELQLQVRIGNEGHGDVAVSEGTFRLVVGDEVRPPVGGVSAYVPSHSTEDLDVRFAVPAGTSDVRLRVTDGTIVADVALALSPGRVRSGTRARPPAAVAVRLDRTPARLVADDGLEATLQGVTIRRFANLLRVSCAVDVAHRGSRLRSLGDLQLRVLAGATSIAPLDAQHVLIEPATDVTVTYEFDVPPDATRVIVRAALAGRSAEVPLEIR